MNKKRLKGVSLFASAGIGETYFKNIGIDIVVANELIERRANLYKSISPETDVICGDITDKNIFNKEVMQANTNTIELENENSKICAFNKKIGVLNKNQFKIYNEFGNEETNLNIEITNPIFKTSNRFIAIAENGGQKLYIIEDKK